MKSLFYRHLVQVACLSFLLALSDHPPPSEILSGYGEVSVAMTTGCALDPAYSPVHHTARRHLLYLFDGLAKAAGELPEAYSVELMRNRDGEEYINAMTCSASRLVWVSVKAWEELHDYVPALALLMAHELGHGQSRSPFLLRADQMLTTERHLFESLTYRQQWEIAADQRAAEIMLRAGYSPEEIVYASRYILEQEGSTPILSASYSHPSGWDRLALLRYYVNRTVPPVAK